MENRKYPRLPVHAQQQIFAVSNQSDYMKNVVVSKNISAAGFCFRSQKMFSPGIDLFVYLDDNLLDDLKVNRARVMKLGNYFMARVVWVEASKQSGDPFFEVGCAFLAIEEGNENILDLFTRFINHLTSEKMTHA